MEVVSSFKVNEAREIRMGEIDWGTCQDLIDTVKYLFWG